MDIYRVGGATVFVSKDFGSLTPDHRARIRSTLRKQIELESDALGLTVPAEALSSLADLSAPPRIDTWGISVSHCPDIGGFAIKPNSDAIGLDLEIASRLTLPVVQRVAAFEGEKKILAALAGHSPFDVDAPLLRAYFWCAKEASIKVCGSTFRNQSSHYSNVELISLDRVLKKFRAQCEGPNSALEISGEFFDVQTKGLVATLAYVDRLVSRH